MVVYSPYPADPVPPGQMLAPRGSYVWLPSRLLVNRVLVAPDSDAFQRNDFYVIRDPDGNRLEWGVTIADPGDPNDTYSSAHGDYRGSDSTRTIADGVTNGTTVFTSASAAFNSNDIGKKVVATGIPANTTISTVSSATQIILSASATTSATDLLATIGTANVGLYAEGGASRTGRFAVKVLVPTDAEDTSQNSSRFYSIAWAIKKNGVIVNGSESFNVGPAGVIVFAGSIISAADVRAGFYTTLEDVDVEAAITEATDAVAAWVLDNCGVDVYDLTEMPPGLRQAILWWTRDLLGIYDAGAGVLPESVQEGGEKLVFGGRGGTKLMSLPMDRALMFLRGWCVRNKTGRSRPFIGVINVNAYETQGIVRYWGDIDTGSTNTILENA